MDEQTAVARLKRGDISALEVLVGTYQVPALDTAFLICHNYALAEDIVQTAFLQAYERIHTFDNTRSFGPWFLRSVANRTITVMNVMAKRADLSWDAQMLKGDDPFSIPSLEPGLQQQFEAVETRIEVLTLLKQLTPGQRAAVVMRYYLDLSDQEIAQRLQVPAGTVRRRLHDAHQRLRQLLPAKV